MNSLLTRYGRCTEDDHHHLFFSERADELARAQEICKTCRVRTVCLETAVAQSVEWGVWGGVIFWDGQALHRKRSRGRPRKEDAMLPVVASQLELDEMVSRSA